MILVWVDPEPLIQVWIKPLSELERKKLQRGAPTAFQTQGIIPVRIPAPKSNCGMQRGPCTDLTCSMEAPQPVVGSVALWGPSCSSSQNLPRSATLTTILHLLDFLYGCQ